MHHNGVLVLIYDSSCRHTIAHLFYKRILLGFAYCDTWMVDCDGVEAACFGRGG